MVCTTLHVFFFCLFSFVVCFVDETPSMCPESISAGEFYTFWSGFDYSRVMALLLIIWCLCPKEPFFWGISRPSFNLRGLSFHCFGPSHGNEAGVETKKLATEMEKISRKKMLEKCGCEFFCWQISSLWWCSPWSFLINVGLGWKWLSTGGRKFERVELQEYKAQWTVCMREARIGSHGCLFRSLLPLHLVI